MLAAGKWALSIVVAGVTLGALLGDAANPQMKAPVPPWWQLTGQNEIVPSSDHAFFEAGPEDLSPFTGYRPDLDYDAEVFAAPIPAYELAALIEEPAPAEDLPSVNYGTRADPAAEAAADEAEAAADAIAAEAPAEAAAPGPRQAELAAAGIY